MDAVAIAVGSLPNMIVLGCMSLLLVINNQALNKTKIAVEILSRK